MKKDTKTFNTLTFSNFKKQVIEVISPKVQEISFSQKLNTYEAEFFVEDSKYIVAYNTINGVADLLKIADNGKTTTVKETVLGSLEYVLKTFVDTKSVTFTVGCMALYKGSMDVPANLTQEEVLSHIREHLNDIPVNDLEWLSDLAPEEAVTMEDIYNINEFKEE